MLVNGIVPIQLKNEANENENEICSKKKNCHEFHMKMNITILSNIHLSPFQFGE